MNKKYFKSLISSYIFLVIILLGSLTIILNNYYKNNSSILVYITFFVNFIIVIINLLNTNEIGYSIDDMIFIFILSFMIIAPILQYNENKFPWGNGFINNNNLIYSNLTIMIFMLSFFICKIFYKNRKNKNYRYIYFKNENIILNISFFISLVCSFYVIRSVGFTNLLSRSTNVVNVENSSISLIINSSFRSFPVISFAIHYIYKDIKGKFYSKIEFIILTLLLLLVNFPTGIARFQVASVYLGCLLIIKNKFKNKYLFKYIILFGLLFIFPIVNIFRNNTFSDLFSANIKLPGVYESFLSGDFDSYSMLVRSIVYINFFGITFGKQLLGNILFFIPRSIWMNKPIGSGALIAQKFNWVFTNVSCPFIGEGIINFGFLGIIIFSIILSFITSKLNMKYNKNILEKNYKITLIRVLYPFMIGFVFFIMRGDLLSSISYMIGFCFPAILLLFMDVIINLRVKYR